MTAHINNQKHNENGENHTLAYKCVNANMHTPLSLYKFFNAKFLLESASMQSSRGRYSILVLSTNFSLIKDKSSDVKPDYADPTKSEMDFKDIANFKTREDSKKFAKRLEFINEETAFFSLADYIRMHRDEDFTYFFKDSTGTYDLKKLASYEKLPPILEYLKIHIESSEKKDHNLANEVQNIFMGHGLGKDENTESKFMNSKDSKDSNKQDSNYTINPTTSPDSQGFITSSHLKNGSYTHLDSKPRILPLGVETTASNPYIKPDFLTIASILKNAYPQVPDEIAQLPLPFGGLGYVGYEFFNECEISSFSMDALYDAPQGILIFPKECIIFDHFYDCAYIVVSGYLGAKIDVQKSLKNIESRLEKITNITTEKYIKSTKLHSRLVYEDSKKWYKKSVKVIKKEIYKGTFLQCVLSRAKVIKSNMNPLYFYESLRRKNPSPYMYYLDFDDFKIIGASPEMMVRCENGVQSVRPIAGTRPRGKDMMEDERLARELLNDEKESAEHLMLVDLSRNDVGRSSQPGSVRLESFRVIEKYSNVMHIVSQVSGKIAEGRSVGECFRACFPAGTVSGAPKIEAIKKIEKYELHSRGIYAGAILCFKRNGDLNSAITLRSAVYKDSMFYLQAGAGIVIDSNPEREFIETENKMGALSEVLMKNR